MKQKSHLITYLSVLSLFFFFFQVMGYLVVNHSVQFLFHLLAKDSMKVPANVYLAQLYFLLAQLSLYAVFTFYVWGVARLLGWLFKLSWPKTCQLGFLVWLLAAVTVLLANQVFFPASAFATLFSDVCPPWLASITFWLCFLVLGLATFLSLASLLVTLWRKSRVLNVSVIVAFAVVGLWLHDINRIAIAKPMASSRPNVIVIGIDSLRPDYVDFDGYKGKPALTPHLDKLLKGSTNFTQAYTPLARTFPSWTAILTGKYPIHNGVRFNLASQRLLDLTDSLAAVLKRQGYTTYYATDDRRFSNVSKKFGFDYVLGPETGANDFVLGTINDLPLSNLIINTRLGQWLFPYNAGNRAAYTTYYPQTFNNIVEEKLGKQAHRPIFLCIHFCLPHWPYAWAKEVYNTQDFPVGLYTQAIKRGDLQIARFIQFLKREGLLKHAIVVVLSDHGEGLLKPHDRIIDKANYVKGPHSAKNIFKEVTPMFMIEGHEFDTSYGHGTDVLSLVQYHTVLAFRTFGLPHKNVEGKTKVLTSLVDIEPTLLSMLQLKIPSHLDGHSIAPYIYGEKIKPKTVPVFMETGFTPGAATSSGLSLHGMIVKGAKVFKINPASDTLVIKPQMAKFIIPGKQRQVIYKNWVLALYPQPHYKVAAVLVNRKTGRWTDDLTSPFAHQAPVRYLLAQLKQLYGKEIDTRYPYLKH